MALLLHDCELWLLLLWSDKLLGLANLNAHQYAVCVNARLVADLVAASGDGFLNHGCSCASLAVGRFLGSTSNRVDMNKRAASLVGRLVDGHGISLRI